MSNNRLHRAMLVTHKTVRAILLLAFCLVIASHPHAVAACGFGPAPSPVPSPVPFIQSISPVPSPVPFIQSISPVSAAPGGAAFTLTVNGANFVATSQVYWGTTPLVTTFVSSVRLTAGVPATLISLTGTGWITVNNPPQAGSSNVFYLPVQTSIASVSYAQVTYAAGNGPANIVQGDFNNDGKMDLAVSNYSGGTISIYLGNGDGTFQAQTIATVPFDSPWGLAVGDFNHDGNLDLVVGEFAQTGVAVLLGEGDGTFQAATTLSGGNSLITPVVVDVNGDGNLDIVSGVYEGLGIDVFLGNGDGTFQPVSDVAQDLTFVASVAAADLNGDGSLDLVALSWGTGFPYDGMDVMFGNGDGTFQSPVHYGPTGSWGLVLGDFNEDGILDVVTSAPEGTKLGFLLYAGTGDGTFAAPQNVGSGKSYSIAAGDLNGDGHLDIIGVDENSAQLDVNLGNGDGSFQPAQTFGSNIGTVYSAVIGNFANGAGLAVAVPDANSSLLVFEAGVALSPISINFQPQPIGLQTAATSVTVTNLTSGTVTLSAITITGINAADFSETDNCFLNSAQLAPGASCTVNVRFTASITDAEFASLNVADNAPSSPQTVPLTGTGIEPVVNLSEANLMFAASPVGTASATQSVTLTNTGAAVLNLSGITLTGTNTGDFAETNNCGASVAASASCTIMVTFTPTADGPRTAAISIADNAVNSPETVQLSGSGADFALSFNTNLQNVAPGSTATFQLTVTPQDGFNGPITLTCADAPATAVCTVTPSGFTLDGAPATASVTLVTPAPAIAAPPSTDGWHGFPAARLQPLIALIGLELLLLAGSRRKALPGRAATAQFTFALAAAMLFATFGLAGCGYTSSRPTTASTSYNLTVTATSGTLSHQSSVSVSVQ